MNFIFISLRFCYGSKCNKWGRYTCRASEIIRYRSSASVIHIHMCQTLRCLYFSNQSMWMHDRLIGNRVPLHSTILQMPISMTENGSQRHKPYGLESRYNHSNGCIKIGFSMCQTSNFAQSSKPCFNRNMVTCL